ncbi:MAG TPA: ATP-grasp domain-containing protein, partial [Clostridia bacterium]|nr:ATP-grasp domain-containing protein [Clostridia bacterium]
CSIDYVFPAHDDVVVALAQNAGRIRAGVVSSPPETCLVARSKSATYRLLADAIPVPELYACPETIDLFPVFVKPDKGQGSRDIQLVHDRDHLRQVVAEHPDCIISEYLPGEEYTVDCFSDRQAGLLFCGGRQRIRIRSGISMDSRPVQDDAFGEYARRISEKLDFHGAWFFQVKRDRHGLCKLMEIAPRIAGTMALYRVLGVNFPLLSIYEQERIPLEIRTNAVDVQIDRALVNRYKHDLSFGVVYVDLDDTLVVNGKANTDLIRLLYQCINAGKRIVLLTRHAGDLDQCLRKHHLTGMFDDVIQLEQAASKADCIHESNAIMIDDSFSERKQVSEKLGIPTFDCGMIEMLFDDRV